MLRLFASVSSCELARDERKQAVARFSADATSIEAAYSLGNPAFNWPYWEPWELLELMAEVARWHNEDHGVQQSYTVKVRHAHGR